MCLPVWWASLLSRKLKEVVPEENGHLVILQKLAALSVLAETAVKDVEGAVVTGRFQILHVVLHFHLDGVAIVVLAAFELLVAVFAFESLQGPLFPRRPRLLAVEQNDGLIRLLKALDELFWTEALGVHSLHVVLDKDSRVGFIFYRDFHNQFHFKAALQNTLHQRRSM